MRFPTLKEREERYIKRVLRLQRGSVQAAARVLGIGRATLYRRLTELGIDKHGRQVSIPGLGRVSGRPGS